MIENVRQAVQNANLYTYLGKIDKIVGTTVEAMGPAAPSIYAQQGKCRNHAAFSTLKTIKQPL
mgnify:CR=1 FL=1